MRLAQKIGANARFRVCGIARAALIALALLAAASSAAGAAEPASADWLSFQQGLSLYGQRRLGEALDAFKQAAEQRSRLFGDALRDIDAILKDKDAKRAGDSISGLIQVFAPRDVIRSDLNAIVAQAGSSLAEEIRLLRQRDLSFDLSNFLRAAQLVMTRRGGSSIGDSLSKLRASATALASYPEAQYWIGRVFLAEGETSLAELQFQEAYAERAAFDAPEQAYLILQSLAELYRDEGRMKDFESSLLSITGDSKLFAKGSDYLRSAMERTLSTQGIDALMALYRSDESFPLRAYSELGKFYLEDGRLVAVSYLMAAVDTELSHVIAAIIPVEPAYEYSDLGELLGRVRDDRDLSAFAADAGLYRDLELLGEALATAGYRESARGIWRVLSSQQGSEPWNRRAAEALARPPSAPSIYPLVKAP